MIVDGVAILLIGGVIKKCSDLKKENERKSRELEREAKRCRRQLAQRRGEIAHERAVNNHKERIKSITAACRAKEQMREKRKKQIASAESDLATFKEHLKQAKKEKAKENREIKKLSKESEEYVIKKNAITQYTSYIRHLNNQIKKYQGFSDGFQEDLSQIEEQIMELGKQKEATRKKIEKLKNGRSRRIARQKAAEEEEEEEE
ncbi:MAG: hypothetical protein IKQ16_07890, partial [Lentisphaeria bacterium]|nr:hypothetical protein [Lentisphaeria bacterium]